MIKREYALREGAIKYWELWSKRKDAQKNILFMISAKITTNYKLTLVVFLQKKKQFSKSLSKYFFIIDISKPNIFFF